MRLSCAEHIADTVCREIYYAGEFRGIVCGYPSPTCSEYQTSTVECDGDEAILCVGGQERRFDCTAEGYDRCEAALGCRD